MRIQSGLLPVIFLMSFLLACSGHTATTPSRPAPGGQMIADYFRAETARIAERCLAEIKTLEDWTSRRDQFRQQLFEMLSLSPLPETTDLKPTVTGRTEHDLFVVENVHFQSLPGLYVTANVYLPKAAPKPLPAILYLCGHGPVIKDKVSFGNKAAYQHHGAWFARNGYVCLTIDTVQLGEIQGLHHGTYREGMWWWNARGYTPAGVEAWNGIRALDYLATRPEVDASRFGVTGRSGGGAYSWWVAALDDRVRAAAPVAGITDLRNHVVDGVVEGHCDCMFTVNTYRWDYGQVAALVAPRPLLIANTDKDTIFPLDGVIRVHEKVSKIYRLYDKSNHLGLLITEGPHKDTQELQLPVFRWFNRHLKGDESVITMPAEKFFEPEQLKVFVELPSEERTSRIHETFVPSAKAPAAPVSTSAWSEQRDLWLNWLREKSFAGWPEAVGPLDLQPVFAVERNGLSFAAFDFASQPGIRLRLYLLQSSAVKKPRRIDLNLLDAEGWHQWLIAMKPGFEPELEAELAALADSHNGGNGKRLEEFRIQLQTGHAVTAWVAPRGVGLTAWDADERKHNHIRRRFMLLGQTLDGMRVWDIRRGLQALRSVYPARDVPLWLNSERQMGANTLYASLFESAVAGLELWHMPASHREGPDYLNVLRSLDMPQAMAMAAERCEVRLHQTDSAGWEYPLAVRRNLAWKASRLDIVALPALPALPPDASK